ncbi:MAG: hypothetical protein K0U89_14740 [Planctomycetes bacterium]|nr:hypothetical protein [Planctomycetota bacterium]
MVVRFVCKCGKSLKAPDEYIGKKVSCSKCGEISRVPEKEKTSESKPKKKKPDLLKQEHVLPPLTEVRSREEVMAEKSSNTPETPNEATVSSNIANQLLRETGAPDGNQPGDFNSPYTKNKPSKEKPIPDDSKWAEEKKYLKEYTKYYGKLILPGAVAVVVICIGLYSLMNAMVSTSDHPTLGTVSGIVTLDDKPLPRAEITFIPQDEWKEDKIPAESKGITNEQGQFELIYSKDLKGAAIGNHFVRIISFEKKVPLIYNVKSVLKFEVKKGSNQADFNLVSK